MFPEALPALAVPTRHLPFLLLRLEPQLDRDPWWGQGGGPPQTELVLGRCWGWLPGQGGHWLSQCCMCAQWSDGPTMPGPATQSP